MNHLPFDFSGEWVITEGLEKRMTVALWGLTREGGGRESEMEKADIKDKGKAARTLEPRNRYANLTTRRTIFGESSSSSSSWSSS